tara:strand:- start:1820 stop:2170 length:351 start_codon:yes stop_codon:yes gene_type:complete
VKGLDWVVEVAQIEFGVSLGRQLVLRLGNENLMLIIGEKRTFLGIEVHIVTPHLGGATGGETITALDANLNIVVLERNEGETLGPVLTKEEWEHVVIPTVVGLLVVCSNRGSRLRS